MKDKDINLYDNTEIFKLVMVVNNREIIWKDRNIPNWLNMNFNSEQ